ncbi:unnamed protein product [Agarophyton chilense]
MRHGRLWLQRHGDVFRTSSTALLPTTIVIFSLRAIQKNVLFAVIFAVLYAVVANCLQPVCIDADFNSIKPLAMNQQLSRNAVRLCLFSSLLLSLLIPWAWILTFSISEQQTKLLAPHLFLMMTQVLFEIWSYRPNVSVVVRICIPVTFVCYRLTVLYQWVRAAAAAYSEQIQSRIMLALATANLAFWSVILFYVLLLKVCPPYFLVERSPTTEAKPK